MSLDITALLGTCQKGLDVIESSILRRNAWQKDWTTVLKTDLPPDTLFSIQRIGCEPPSIEVSLLYLLSCETEKRSERQKRLHTFNQNFTEAIRNAHLMCSQNAFLTPTQSLAIKADKKRERLSALRESGMLPDRYFLTQHIVVVTEIASGRQESVAIMQSPQFPELIDMKREGKRQLSEKILRESALSDAIDLTEKVIEPVIPTQVVISAKEGGTFQTISYDAIGGNISPLSLEEL